jgi:lipopolysaccharide biosynthesis glycosyltransferase
MAINAVVFAISDRLGTYWPYTALALASMLSHATDKPQVSVLHDGSLSPQGAARLNEIADRAGASLTVLEVKLSQSVDIKDFGAYTVASSFRLLIPSLFQADDAVLYLDSDVIVHGVDVQELFTIIREGKAALVAVRDPFIRVSASHRQGLEKLGLDPHQYFNSGVLGFYMPQREVADASLLQDFFAWYRSVGTCHHPDQDFLNLKFRDRWTAVDERFNFQVSIHERRMFLPPQAYFGKILHYAGKAKPLGGYLAPGSIPFWSYASQVPECLMGLEHPAFRYLMPEIGNEHAAKVLAIKPR